MIEVELVRKYFLNFKYIEMVFFKFLINIFGGKIKTFRIYVGCKEEEYIYF